MAHANSGISNNKTTTNNNNNYNKEPEMLVEEITLNNNITIRITRDLTTTTIT